jgi:predicted lipoprotein with Yx(FWY)xxD motif
MRKRSPDTRSYAVVVVGVALLVAGCGSSAKKTTTTGNANRAASGGTVSLAANSASTAATGAALTLGRSPYGKVIFDARHRALYLFAADHGAKSTCYDVCASAWPPLLTKGAPRVPAGLGAGLIGTTKRKDGSMQVTYGGHPLYYYSGDKGSGIACQHANMHGGFWFVVSADGRANTAMGHGMMMSGSHGMKTSGEHEMKMSGGHKKKMSG